MTGPKICSRAIFIRLSTSEKSYSYDDLGRLTALWIVVRARRRLQESRRSAGMEA